jgi:chromosome segregation protein
LTKINKLVMRGFKSFAHKTELLFEDGFNVVLGPNGSGKSNILDAVCFVLGKTSAKALRSEKSANLIYNGGKARKPAAEAEVSIYFDNTKKTFPIESDEVKVTRLVKSKGNSIYKINDEKRTRQQVVDMLGLAKIDPDGYNIILQGDIARFVEMPAVERRLLIEEISGVSIYEEKKNKALRELGKVEEKLKETTIVLNERDSRLRELKKERDQALEFNDLSEKIKRNKATLLHRGIQTKSQEMTDFDKKTKSTKERHRKALEGVSEFKDKILTKKLEVNEINKEIERKGEKEQVDVHKAVEKLKVDLATSKDRVKSCNQELEKIKERKFQVKQNYDDIDSKLKGLEKEKKEIEIRSKQLKSELAVVDDRLAKFRSKHELDSLEKVEKEIETLDQSAEELQKAINELRQEQQEVLREKDKIELQIQTIDEKIEKVLTLEKENKDQLDVLKQHKVEFKKASKELNILLDDDNKLTQQLSSARQRLLVANEELAKLNAQNKSVQESLAGNIALKKILEQKRKIPGILGTVSELGNVKSKFALALEIAAGPRIRGVVVEDDNTAARCIKYLKENRLGTATFLPLNKIKPKGLDSKAKTLIDAKGSYGKAVDLIDFDVKFKTIFQYVFGDTIIVDDIEVARRLGVGSAKMVTLEGDVTEFSGAMQGGYRQKSRGGLGFKQKEIQDQIKKHEQESDNCCSLIGGYEKRKKSNEDEIVRLRHFKANVEGEIIKLEKSLHLDGGDLSASQEVKKELNNQLKAADARVEAVLMKVSEENKKLAQNKIARQQLKNKIGQLKSPTLVAELNTFGQKKQELKEEQIKLNSDLTNLDAQLKNILIPEKENSLKILKQHEKEEEDFRVEVKALKERMVLLEKDLKEKEKQQKQFYEKFKGLFTKRTKAEEEIVKLEEKLESLDDSLRKLEQKMTAISLEETRVNAELKSLEHEYENFKGVELFTNKSEQQMKSEITRSEGRIASMGSINMKSLEIYDDLEREYNKMLEKKDKLVVEKEDVLIMMAEIEDKKKELFMETFKVVNEQFVTFFMKLSSKGEAYLVLENPEDPFEGGLLVRVRITGEKFMDIRSLSGGEKTMTALAFIFAIQEHDPASFYVMDEVDAALDKRNSTMLANLVREYCNRAQYVVISHNDSVIAKGDRLYGVSMDENGRSKVVSIEL